MAIDLVDLKAEFGDYYIAGGQNEARLYQELFQGSVTEGFLTPIVTDDTIWRGAKAVVNSLVQSFQKDWTPKGGTAFLPLEIENFKMKVDDEICPDDVEATWLGFLASESLSREEWPLVRYIVEKMYLPKIKEDLELNEIYHGVYVVPTPGVANPDGANMDGLGKKIADGIIATTINVVPVGLITPATIFDQVEAFAKGITGVYKMKDMNIYMSEDNAQLYDFAKRDALGTNPTYAKGERPVDFTNKNVVGLPSMVGSDRFWSTPKENAVVLKKKSQNKEKFKLEENKRVVDIMTDFWDGVGFIINEVVWVSENV